MMILLEKAVAAADKYPSLAEYAKRFVVERAVPFNRKLGIKIARVASDSSEVVLRLPPRRSNLNVAGTIHGGAILALAESVHGVAILWQFSPFHHVMFTKHAALQFTAPGRGELRAVFGLTPVTKAEIETALIDRSRSEFTLECVVTDGAGTEVAKLSATYVIRRNTSL